MKAIVRNSAITRLHRHLVRCGLNFDVEYAKAAGSGGVVKASKLNDEKFAASLRGLKGVGEMTGGVVAKYRAELERHGNKPSQHFLRRLAVCGKELNKAQDDLAEARQHLSGLHAECDLIAQQRSDLSNELAKARQQNAELNLECNRLDRAAEDARDRADEYRLMASNRHEDLEQLTARLAAAEAYLFELLREDAE
jgi:chromosome segregation ATPase